MQTYRVAGGSLEGLGARERRSEGESRIWLFLEGVHVGGCRREIVGDGNKFRDVLVMSDLECLNKKHDNRAGIVLRGACRNTEDASRIFTLEHKVAP